MKLIMSAAMVLVVATGCMGPSTGGLEVILKEGEKQAIVRIDDSSFAKRIVVEETIARRSNTGFLGATVKVRNRFDRDFPIQYRFEWFDGDGMEIQSGGRPWEQAILHGGAAAMLSATASDKRGVRFVVRLRRVE